MPESCTVIFDVDGTLVDSTYHHALSWSRAFAAFDIELPLWRIHRSVGMGGDQLVPALCGDEVEERLGDDLRSRWSAEFKEIADEVKPLPGARDLVDTLRRAGHQVCAASSGNGDDTERSLRLLDLVDVLDVVVSGDDVEDSKPAPDLFEVCWERAGRGPAVVVGDTVYDVAAATKVGLACVTVRTGGFGAAELEEAGAALVVEDLTDLLDAPWDYLASGAAAADMTRTG